MSSLELSDPDGDALTITTDADGIWVTCTGEVDEVTVGPFSPAAFMGGLPELGRGERGTSPVPPPSAAQS